MGRGTSKLSTERLSSETPEVQEALLKDILEPRNSGVDEENEVNPGKTKKDDMNNLSIKKEKSTVDKPVINIGDKVRINPNVGNDMLGKRIHAGLKRCVYTVKVIRQDGFIVITCLNNVFTVKNDEVTKI